MRISAKPQAVQGGGKGRALVPAVLVICGLAACGDYSADYPTLMPTDQVLAPPTLPSHAAEAAQSPQVLEAELSAKAAHAASGKAARAPVLADTGDLAARAAALQSRATALSQTPMGDDGPACPEDAQGCPPTGPDPASH